MEKIGIFCSASENIDKMYFESASQIGKWMGQTGKTLIYGGASLGLMECIARAVKENGNRTDNFAQVVNSNLPESFTIQMPIFKGMQPETIEVETFAQVNGREVAFVLLSPGAQATLEDLRDKVIDEQLKQIREIAPEIAIIEV